MSQALPVNNPFPAAVIKTAQDSQRASGCPASVALAQWALESSWGKRTPPGSNNCFGIKAYGNCPFVVCDTKEWSKRQGREITVRAKFRKFVSIKECFDYHGKMLTSPKGYYAGAIRYLSDPIKWARAIGHIYATDPQYSEKIVELMIKFQLQRFDAAPVA